MKRWNFVSSRKTAGLLLSAFSLGLLAFGFTNAAILQDAIQRGYDNGLTSFNTSSTFRSFDGLRRDEAAKFFVEFARLQNPIQDLSYNLNCNFKDISQSRPDLKEYVSTACQMGILRGSNGYVMPTQSLTNAQAVTVAVRIVDGLQSEANVAHRADNYYKRAMELKLDLSGFRDKDAAASRGNVIMLLYDAAHKGTWLGGSSGNSKIDDILQQLLDILEE